MSGLNYYVVSPFWVNAMCVASRLCRARYMRAQPACVRDVVGIRLKLAA